MSTHAITGRRAVPILLYHSVTESPSDWIAPFAVTPEVFRSHLDVIVESGRVAMTVSEFVDGMEGRVTLPPSPVVITFDDGFADTAEVAAPLMRERGLPGTVYVTTGFMEGTERPHGAEPVRDRMLDPAGLAALVHAGIEIGAHTATHPQLDTLPLADAEAEILASRALLEDIVGQRVRTFAYPHGYSSRPVRDLVRRLGFDSACAVKNALSSPSDDRFALARLMVRSSTTLDHMAAWLEGEGAPDAQRRDAARTVAWRAYRRMRRNVMPSASRQRGRSRVS